jgi:hypothetical protein
MADLARLLMPKRRESAHTVDAESDATGVGDGVAQASAETALDPVSDAVNQLSALQSFFAVLSAGGNPTASQIAAAQSALGAIGADLRQLQLQPAPPPGSKIWVSAPAAIGAAAGAGLVGGVIGYLVRGEKGAR